MYTFLNLNHEVQVNKEENNEIKCQGNLDKEINYRKLEEKILPPILKKIDGTNLRISIKKKLHVDKENNYVKLEEEFIPPILKTLVGKKIPIILRNAKRFDVDVLKYLEKNHYKEVNYKQLYPRISLEEYE